MACVAEIAYPRPRAVHVRRAGKIYYLGTASSPTEARAIREGGRNGSVALRHARRVGFNDDEAGAPIDALMRLAESIDARLAESGARRLVAAVVAQALDDLSGRRCSHADRASAVAWVFGGQRGALGMRFDEALGVLGIDAEAAMPRLRASAR